MLCIVKYFWVTFWTVGKLVEHWVMEQLVDILEYGTVGSHFGLWDIWFIVYKHKINQPKNTGTFVWVLLFVGLCGALQKAECLYRLFRNFRSM